MIRSFRNFRNFFTNNVILCVSFLLAIISTIYVGNLTLVIGYIDKRVIALLFSLMTVVASLEKDGVFNTLAIKLSKKANTIKKLALVLVSLCFFLSMLITNDVALITFVPFTIMLLKDKEYTYDLITILIIETTAANLGSMLTPIGNPQNLFLFNLSKMSFIEFINLMSVYTIVSYIVIIATIFLALKDKKYVYEIITEEQEVKNRGVEEITEITEEDIRLNKKNGNNQNIRDLDNDLIILKSKESYKKYRVLISIVLFIISLLTVGRILNYWYLLSIVVIIYIFLDKDVFKLVDYKLLLTFIFLFIFIGNLTKVQYISDFIAHYMKNREIIFSVLLSQVISNVPSAILLANYTDNINKLIVGVNIGGLGTLIASMASLITYKYFNVFNSKLSGKYLIMFTIYNLFLLFIMFSLSLIL